MLRWLAAEGESYRGDCAPGSVTGSTACRIEARCFTKGAVVGNTAGVPPARLPAGRYSSSRGSGGTFKPPPAAQCAIVPPENGL